MTIRIMTAADAGEVARLTSACLNLPAWDAAAYTNLLGAAGRGGGFVAEAGGEMAGFSCFRVTGQDAESLTLAVRADWRRCGLGPRLLAQTLREATRRGAARMFLEVRAQNAEALRMYEGMGFRRIGLRRGYYFSPADDALTLECALPSSRPLRWSAEFSSGAEHSPVQV